MDFSQYPDSTVISMTVYDLPPDAVPFLLRGERSTPCIGASSDTAQRQWEYRWEQDKYVWRIWHGTSDYYAQNGDPISHWDAASIIWKASIAPYQEAHPELRLPDGL